MRRQLLPAVLMLLVMTVLTGLLYPALVTGIGLGVFPDQANGSLVEMDDSVVGSRLLGQTFTDDDFFHARPSAVDYDPSASSGSNLGPTNPELVGAVEERIDRFRAVNGLAPDAPVPVDAITASASGLDPHISPATALLQVPRIAAARGLPAEDVTRLVAEHTNRGFGGVFGAPVVNVVELNIALEEVAP